MRDKFTLSISFQCITYITLKRKTIISTRIPLLSQMKCIINYVFFFKNQKKTLSFPHSNRTSEISERFQFLILHSEKWSRTYRVALKYKSTHASRCKIGFWCFCSKQNSATCKTRITFNPYQITYFPNFDALIHLEDRHFVISTITILTILKF